MKLTTSSTAITRHTMSKEAFAPKQDARYSIGRTMSIMAMKPRSELIGLADARIEPIRNMPSRPTSGPSRSTARAAIRGNAMVVSAMNGTSE
ncbi:hypothetical protein QE379_002113 [Sphingomonas sp. SORGH_AS 879]|nr:hypothetical protein [Sphingomonas sp. SORGH_AS_0879]